MFFQERPHCKIGKTPGAGGADNFAFEIFDGANLLVTEQKVVRRARCAADNRQVQAARAAPEYRLGAADAGKLDFARGESRDGRRPAANKNRFDLQSLLLE